jgi:hypothetical protein
MCPGSKVQLFRLASVKFSLILKMYTETLFITSSSVIGQFSTVFSFHFENSKVSTDLCNGVLKNIHLVMLSFSYEYKGGRFAHNWKKRCLVVIAFNTKIYVVNLCTSKFCHNVLSTVCKPDCL